MASSGTILQQAIELGKKAVVLDQQGKHEGAAYYYEQSAGALEGIVATESNTQATWAVKAAEYRQRAKALRHFRKLVHGNQTTLCWKIGQGFISLFPCRSIITCSGLFDRGTAISFESCPLLC